MRRIVIAGLVLALGCGGSEGTDVRSSGPTSFQGSSAIFSVSDGYLAQPDRLGGPPVSALDLAVLDFPAACGGSDGGIPSGRHGLLSVTLGRLKPEAIGPGIYRLAGDIDAGSAQAYFHPFESSCGGNTLGGVSGQIELSRLDEGTAEGTLDVNLLDGTRLEGPFVAGRCPPVTISPLPDGGYPQLPVVPLCPWAQQ